MCRLKSVSKARYKCKRASKERQSAASAQQDNDKSGMDRNGPKHEPNNSDGAVGSPLNEDEIPQRPGEGSLGTRNQLDTYSGTFPHHFLLIYVSN